jgi:DNA-binding NtrC family response regulator
MEAITAKAKLPLVLFIDDDTDFLEQVRFVLLANRICDMVLLADSRQAMDELAKGGHAAVILDWVMPHLSGADLLPLITRQYPNLPVVIMTGTNDVDTVVSCMRQGAMDFITKPLDAARLISSLNNALRIAELSQQNQQLQGYLLGTPLADPDLFSSIITASERMQTIFKLIETISPSRFPVLITGETGVGKELIASAVHRASGVPGSFVPVNVAGLDAQMLDDTLFGHRKGAFTGASDAREGLIARAQGGTLVLDEIGDLAHESQVKLLRLLQEHQYYRIGSDVLQKSTARIIVASNRDFNALIAENRFRADLYHRLSCHKLHIPPLRERPEDIPLLVRHFAGIAARSVGRPVPDFSGELRLLLHNYPFPGNVRELINLVSSAVIANQSGILTPQDFPGLTMASPVVGGATGGSASGQFRLHVLFPTFPTMDQVERLMLQEALKVTGGMKQAAAELLGISRQTLRKWQTESDREEKRGRRG